MLVIHEPQCMASLAAPTPSHKVRVWYALNHQVFLEEFDFSEIM